MAAKTGDLVKVHYVLTLDSGDEIDSTYDDEPLELTIGSEDFIAAFEESIVGMNPGDKKKVLINAEDAYGEYDETLTHQIPISALELDGEAEVGDMVIGTSEDGEEVPMMIAEIDGDQVVLDANHPLAGEDLIFDIELLEIVSQKSN